MRTLHDLSIIQNFKHGNGKWIVSVGMISEGTNIPRLRVCCHLTRVKTELYFRQVLGRILRASCANQNEEGFLYMPAEDTLIDYASRISEDVPASNVVNFEVIKQPAKLDREYDGHDTSTDGSGNKINLDLSFEAIKYQISDPRQALESSMLDHSYRESLNISGRLKKEILGLHLTP